MRERIHRSWNKVGAGPSFTGRVDSKPQPVGEHVDYSVLDTTDIAEGLGQEVRHLNSRLRRFIFFECLFYFRHGAGVLLLDSLRE